MSVVSTHSCMTGPGDRVESRGLSPSHHSSLSFLATAAKKKRFWEELRLSMRRQWYQECVVEASQGRVWVSGRAVLMVLCPPALMFTTAVFYTWLTCSSLHTAHLYDGDSWLIVKVTVHIQDSLFRFYCRLYIFVFILYLLAVRVTKLQASIKYIFRTDFWRIRLLFSVTQHNSLIAGNREKKFVVVIHW